MSDYGGSTAVKQYLNGQGLQCKAILFLDNCAAHPGQDVLRSNDGLIQWFSTGVPRHPGCHLLPLGVPQALPHLHTALFYFLLIPLSMLNLMIVL